MPTEEDLPPGVSESGLLRATRAEAAAKERLRLLGILELRELATRADARTADGRLAAGVQHAIDLIRGNPGTVPTGATQHTYVHNATDAVELLWLDPLDDPDPFPVRVVVSDGGVDQSATAFLSLDEAEQAFTEGLELVAFLRQRRREHQQRESTDGG